MAIETVEEWKEEIEWRGIFGQKICVRTTGIKRHYSLSWQQRLSNLTEVAYSFHLNHDLFQNLTNLTKMLLYNCSSCDDSLGHTWTMVCIQGWFGGSILTTLNNIEAYEESLLNWNLCIVFFSAGLLDCYLNEYGRYTVSGWGSSMRRGN